MCVGFPFAKIISSVSCARGSVVACQSRMAFSWQVWTKRPRLFSIKLHTIVGKSNMLIGSERISVSYIILCGSHVELNFLLIRQHGSTNPRTTHQRNYPFCHLFLSDCKKGRRFSYLIPDHVPFCSIVGKEIRGNQTPAAASSWAPPQCL